MPYTFNYLTAMLGGLLLGFMVYFNGIMAKYLGAVPGSFIVHLVGLVISIFILIYKKKSIISVFKSYSFHWSHCAGFFGALAVTIIGHAVNSELGIASTIGAIILGQIIYGQINDYFGFFGSKKRAISYIDVAQAIFILIGVGVMTYA